VAVQLMASRAVLSSTELVRKMPSLNKIITYEIQLSNIDRPTNMILSASNREI
jgi:hypothetical protein